MNAGSKLQRISALCACAALLACGHTTDSLGDTHRRLNHLIPPATYPNAFRDLLGKTDAEIDDHIEATYQQLFHGDSTQAFLIEYSPNSAYIRDFLHNDIRTEGIGWGMLISVELGKRDEFDKLWRYAKTVAVYPPSSPYSGYFKSTCDTGTSTTAECADPFGLEQFVMALIFANDRWGNALADIDYEADAIQLFDLMLGKGQEATDAGVTNSFDSTNKLIYDIPNVSASSYTRPSLEMPGYYRLWAEATGNSFWLDAAAAADGAAGYLYKSANATTGLWPVRAYFDGTPVSGSDTFDSEAYRTGINLSVDQIWGPGSSANVPQANRLLGFFSGLGITTYGKSFQLDGTVIDATHDVALILANGSLALITTNSDRTAYVQAVWDQATPTADLRYYAGMLDLLALMILGGRLQVI